MNIINKQSIASFFSIQVLLMALLAFANFANAADADIYADKDGAIRGADPVAYFSLKAGDSPVLGSDAFTHEWKGSTWKFASDKNRALFIKNPEKYAPQYGGYCAFAVSHGFTKSVRPEFWKIVDGKLYLNYNKTAYGKWERDQAPAISRADGHWPTVLSKCEKNQQCGKGLE